ncbi:hypothetical protein HG536_0C00990 [Torulaspora globosa]|uniref:Exocyst complex component SEC5 n=1 Tax=Torulaspora globosa TaxID=48254 RepID=A0A7G3ZEJ6_9SACH|nr:uncharacterized protein HG536_0C00990 [Torulaspora globosa]QLL31932.1 hypothetical protein HG536_0C00990 [Torulaspora globosa]
MVSFQTSDEQLLEFYQLKSLNPMTSWDQDSSVLVDLAKWEGVEPDAGNSYDILKDLLLQHQQMNALEAALSSKDLSLDDICDPLSNQQMLPLLDKLGIPEEDRLKYLINSKKFDAKAFLRDVHSADTFEHLSQSLDNLDKSLQVQSEDLKGLVQANFARYVRIKNRLDQIYEQFSEKSGAGVSGDSNDRLEVRVLSDKVDESAKATTVKLKPVLETSKRILSYKATKTFIEANREFFNAPKAMRQCLEKDDYKNLTFQYARAKELYGELIQNYDYEEDENGTRRAPLVAKKIMEEVERVIDCYRQRTWDCLVTPSEGQTQQEFLPLISKLLDLKIDRNPVTAWISSTMDKFEKELNEVSAQLHQKMVNAQKAILRNGSESDDSSAMVDGVDLSYYLSIRQIFPELGRYSGDRSQISTNQDLTDSPILIESWLIYVRYVNMLERVGTRFAEFWEHVQKFLDGTYQASLVNDKKKDNILVGDLSAVDGDKEFLHLQDMQQKDVRNRADRFVGLFYEKLRLLFQSSQDSFAQGQISNKESGQPEDYGFIPPQANGLSCLRYLPKMVEPLLRLITELAQLGISSNTLENSRKLATTLINRCVGAIASLKLRDISNFYKLEDWTVYENVSDQQGNEYGVTQFPEIVFLFQTYCIKITRDLLFAFEKLPVFNGISVVSYPSKQALTATEIQQLISMEAVLEAILKNAAKDKNNPRNAHTILTLTNLQYIREVSFPNILQQFDEAFELNLTEKNLELFTLLSKMESSILGNYLSELKINIRDILEQRFNEVNWATHTSNSFRAGDYIIEVLMLLITIHSECSRVGPQLISRILKESQIFISKYLFEAFKPYIGNLSSDGLLQVTVDLEFFRKVLGTLLEKDTEITLTACLQNCFQNNIDRMARCIKETEPIVSANLTRTSTQFAAFK